MAAKGSPPGAAREPRQFGGPTAPSSAGAKGATTKPLTLEETRRAIKALGIRLKIEADGGLIVAGGAPPELLNAIGLHRAAIFDDVAGQRCGVGLVEQLRLARRQEAKARDRLSLAVARRESLEQDLAERTAKRAKIG